MFLLDDDKMRSFIALLAGRSEKQSKELYEMCEEEIDSYLTLEVLIKVCAPDFVPADKKALEEFLTKQYASETPEFETTFVTDKEKIHLRETMYPMAFVCWWSGKTKSVLDWQFKLWNIRQQNESINTGRGEVS